MLLRDHYGGRLGCLSCDLFDLNGGLEELSLTNTDLGHGGRAMLCGVLSHNTTLKVLKLHGASFDENAAQQLRIAMAKNTTMTEIDDFIPKEDDCNERHYAIPPTPPGAD